MLYYLLWNKANAINSLYKIIERIKQINKRVLEKYLAQSKHSESITVSTED